MFHVIYTGMVSCERSLALQSRGPKIAVSPLDLERHRLLSRSLSLPLIPGGTHRSSFKSQAQLLLFQRVIAALLLLLGAGIAGPAQALAKDPGRGFVDFSDEQAAAPADDAEEAFQFQSTTTRGARNIRNDDREAAAEMEVDASVEVADDEATPREGDHAGEAGERFSRRSLLETIPVQYPLDDSAYEGEDPDGQETPTSEGDWRSSSVERPDADLPLEERSWIELHKFTFVAQTLTSGADNLEITSIEAKQSFKFARWPFLFVTPRAGIHFVSAPASTDLPPDLYDFSLDTTAFIPINDRWMIQLAAVPSVFSDLKATQHAFRMMGRGLVFYRWSQELQLAGGFVYLDRQDIKALPAAGFIWSPSDDVKLDIMFPRPRIGYRYTHNEERERWVYATGELGGGSWAFQRTNGTDDVVTYNDLQLLLGIENKTPAGLSWQFEAGYVFNRRLEYLSTPGEIDYPSTAVLRVILSY